jgi:hypothetical protein
MGCTRPVRKGQTCQMHGEDAHTSTGSPKSNKQFWQTHI